jgi:hypothetical protein
MFEHRGHLTMKKQYAVKNRGLIVIKLRIVTRLLVVKINDDGSVEITYDPQLRKVALARNGRGHPA